MCRRDRAADAKTRWALHQPFWPPSIASGMRAPSAGLPKHSSTSASGSPNIAANSSLISSHTASERGCCALFVGLVAVPNTRCISSLSSAKSYETACSVSQEARTKACIRSHLIPLPPRCAVPLHHSAQAQRAPKHVRTCCGADHGGRAARTDSNTSLQISCDPVGPSSHSILSILPISTARWLAACSPSVRVAVLSRLAAARYASAAHSPPPLRTLMPGR